MMTPGTATDTPTPPDIPGFTMRFCCGRGSSGEVWIGHDADDIPRAVKFIRRRPGGDARFEAGKRAIRIYRKLAVSHPSLLNILFTGETGDGRYEITEPADNRLPPECGYEPDTLEARLKQDRMSRAEALAFFRQLVDGVAALHRAGFAHGDLKPANLIFIHGRLVIADPELLSLSDKTVCRGTPGYFPPRPCTAGEADIYALGKILYQLLFRADVSRFPELPDAPVLYRSRRHNQIMLRCCMPDIAGPINMEELAKHFSLPRPAAIAPNRFLIPVLLCLILLMQFFPVNIRNGRFPGRHPSKPAAATLLPADTTPYHRPTTCQDTTARSTPPPTVRHAAGADSTRQSPAAAVTARSLPIPLRASIAQSPNGAKADLRIGRELRSTAAKRPQP